MIRLISAIFEAVAGWFRWRTNPRLQDRREQQALETRIHRTTTAVNAGDEDEVNRSIHRSLRAVPIALCGALLLAVSLTAGGCCAHRGRVVYVPESARAIRHELDGRRGWWLPDPLMAQLLEAAERCRAMRDNDDH